MAKLYTGTGDRGETGLADGSRVPKDDLRVCACGAVDELNALIGMCRASCSSDTMQAKLQQVQNDLFVMGGVLASPTEGDTPATSGITAEHIRRLEEWIDQADRAVPPLRSFVLPAGCESACRLHHARTVCRRAERRIVGLIRSHAASERALVYLNRLSDLLFAWARQTNHDASVAETTWPDSKAES
jgi:cob(I)alamin adenosyltransferase